MLSITDDTMDSDIITICAMPDGTVVNITGQLELALNRLQTLAPSGTVFVYIRPGTASYSLYGANHVVKTTVTL